MRSDLHDFVMQLHYETEKAVLVSDDGDREHAVWLPKAHIEIALEKGAIATVKMARRRERTAVKRAIPLALLLFVSPAQAESCRLVDQGFAPFDNLEAKDVRLIDGARFSIDFAAYVLTDIAIVEALTRAAERGVKVRVYRDGHDARTPRRLGAAIDRLAAEANVEIRYKASPAPLMHLKAYLVDGRLLRTGAGNFSHSGLKAQDNDLVVLDCASAVAAFRRDFEAMWRR